MEMFPTTGCFCKDGYDMINRRKQIVGYNQHPRTGRGQCGCWVSKVSTARPDVKEATSEQAGAQRDREGHEPPVGSCRPGYVGVFEAMMQSREIDMI